RSMGFDETARRYLHRWRMFGKSWARRLGRDPACGRARKRIVRRRPRDQQQSNGNDGRYPRAGSVEEAFIRHDPHGFALPDGRHDEIYRGLEEERLENGRQEAGQECRPVACARSGGRTPRCFMALGEGSLGSCRERTRRRAGKSGDSVTLTYLPLAGRSAACIGTTTGGASRTVLVASPLPPSLRDVDLPA